MKRAQQAAPLRIGRAVDIFEGEKTSSLRAVDAAAKRKIAFILDNFAVQRG